MTDTQPRLFTVAVSPDGAVSYPEARHTDPESSRAAAWQHRIRASSNAALIMVALRKSDGQTGHELAMATGLGQVECIRRCGSLRDAGLVVDRESDKRCRVKPDSKQQRWWLTEAAR